MTKNGLEILTISSKRSDFKGDSVFITNSLLRAEASRQSILEKAFEGKLVAHVPNDESASVLLERIKTEGEKNKAMKNVKEKTANQTISKKH